MKRLILSLSALILTALVCSASASANWGGKSNCGWKETPLLEHCYSVTHWKPNVHKNIREVWEYVNGEDIRFGSLPNPAEEFTTLETWVSWSIPGTKVEYLMAEPPKWVEGGESYGKGYGAQCHPFYAAEYRNSAELNSAGERPYLGGAEEILPTACPSTTRQLFQFRKTEGSGEVCVYVDENEVFCNPPDVLPSGPFTDLEAGNEEATFNYPAGIKGSVEAFAAGGIENRWHGSVGSKQTFFEQATCVSGNGVGNVEFSGGGDCPGTEVGTPYHPEEEGSGPVEEDSSQIHSDVSGSNEEGSESTPASKEKAPTSDVDAFAGYKAPKGKISKKEAEEKARKEVAEQGKTPSSVEAHATTVQGKGISDDENELQASAMTAGQKEYMKTKVYVVEMAGSFRGPTGASQDEEVNEYGTGWKMNYENVVYGESSGQVLARSWGDIETAKEAAKREAMEAECAKSESKCGTPHERCVYWKDCDGLEDCTVWHESCDAAEECEFYHKECTAKQACRLYYEGCTSEEACTWWKVCSGADDVKLTSNLSDAPEARTANQSQKPPPGPDAEEQEEPYLLEVTAVAASKPIRDARIAVKRGRKAIARSQHGRLKIGVKAGTYEITASAAKYQCQSKEVRVWRRRDVTLKCHARS